MIEKIFNLIPQRLAGFFVKNLKKISFVQNRIDREINTIMEDLETSMKPYKQDFKSHTSIPGNPV